MNLSFRGNCLFVALYYWFITPNTKIRWMRNKNGRWHCYWITNGLKYEFYTPGASQKTYIQNMWVRGTVRQIN